MSENKQCSATSCERDARARGLCPLHYKRLHYHTLGGKALHEHYAKRDVTKARQKIYLQRPEVKARTVERNRLKVYGVSREQFERLYAASAGCCYVCFAPGRNPYAPGDVRAINIDHDHVTGKVRGLLCAACNKGLGAFRDNPQLCRAAAVYLEKAD